MRRMIPIIGLVAGSLVVRVSALSILMLAACSADVYVEPCRAPGAPEKCSTETTERGWCVADEWPESDERTCHDCNEWECGGVRGCKLIGSACQFGEGATVCPDGCCSACY
jgi:hypothetical protein